MESDQIIADRNVFENFYLNATENKKRPRVVRDSVELAPLPADPTVLNTSLLLIWV